MTIKVPLNLPCYVDTGFFTDAVGLKPGVLVMVTWRPSRCPVFDAVVDNQGLFCDLPLRAFLLEPKAGVAMPNLVPKRALLRYPDNSWTGVYPCFEGKSLTVFGEGGRYFVGASYLFSMELDRNNDLFHFLKIGPGIGMFPNHQVMIGKHTKTPSWKPLTRDYSLLEP